MVTLLHILKAALIGKTIKVETYRQDIKSAKSVITKSSVGVTDAQFATGISRFRKFVSVPVIIGKHKKFEKFRIVDVYIDGNYTEYEIHLTLENGDVVPMRPDMIDCQDINNLFYSF